MQKMLPKIVRLDCLLAYALCLTLVCGARFPQYCSECEQEVWEEVPCSDIPKTTPRTSTQPPIVPTTVETTPTLMPPVTPTNLPPPLTTTTPPPIMCASGSAPITPQLQASKPFRKCYCDCKLGCKEFCRKVAYAGPRQQITQMSATADYVPGAQMEITHLLQRKIYDKSQANVHPYLIQQTPTGYSQPISVDTSYATPISGSPPSGKAGGKYAYMATVGYAPVIGTAVAPSAPSNARAAANAQTQSSGQSYNAVGSPAGANYVAKGAYPGYISSTQLPATSFDNAIDNYLHDYVYGNRGREAERSYSNY